MAATLGIPWRRGAEQLEAGKNGVARECGADALLPLPLRERVGVWGRNRACVRRSAIPSSRPPPARGGGAILAQPRSAFRQLHHGGLRLLWFGTSPGTKAAPRGKRVLPERILPEGRRPIP